MPTTPATAGHWVRLRSALVGLASGLAPLLMTDAAAAAQDLTLLVVEAPPAGPAADAQLKQLRVQFEPALKVELSFINRVCQLSDKQRRALIAESQKWLDQFIRDFAKRGGQVQPGMVLIRAAGRRQVRFDDPRESIRTGLEKLVKSTLPSEQLTLYEEEARKRSEFHKLVALENLVARIDEQLMLAPEQREKIQQSLATHWDQQWAPQLELFVRGIQARPHVPDVCVRPHLSSTQQVAWKRLHNGPDRMVMGGFAFGMDGEVIDDIDLEEVAAEPLEPAEQAKSN